MTCCRSFRPVVAFVLGSLVTTLSLAAAPPAMFTPTDMDTSAPVCQDFYQYAVGGWLKKNPVPGEFARWGAFSELAERNREALHTILERLSKERDKASEGSKELREKYGAHVAKMLELLGGPKEAAEAEAKTVLALETRLAEASMTRVERRDPDKTYNRMDAAALAKLTPALSWKAYLDGWGVPETTGVNIGQPKFFEEASKELAETPLADWKTYLRWHLVHAAAPTL